ncbi:hypothetical protein ACFWY9_17950 [Amycolatopsis sp. NPDC059027]|uniref:hypothetical protein n=1 Tax=Amycolatopsis sp. NPDC059027 TaxID=3346709 RepID=UPI00366D1758
MDPRERADALLARARARGAFVVTPDKATSPMDSANTQQIPRSLVTEIDRGHDPDTTTQLPASLIEENDHPLATSAPTTRLDVPGNHHQATTPLTPRPQAKPIASPLKDQPVPEQQPSSGEEVGGLIPTIKQTSGRSNLSRRLDGI